MKPCPLLANEAARQQILEHYHILDTLFEADFDNIVKLASQIYGMPISLVCQIDQEWQWFKAKMGLEPTVTHRDYAFCEPAIACTSQVRFGRRILLH